jgi:(p)ppGpp synthase/HD superfamily hydrolase
VNPVDPTPSAIPQLLDALHFASIKHSAQRRKGDAGEPYINHIIDVVNRIAHACDAVDIDLLVAAALHDTLEDTETSREELRDRFGSVVAGIVAEVTDDKSLNTATRKRLQVENAPHKSASAKCIKVADKTSNLRSILYAPAVGWSNERKREYFTWATAVVDGCRGVNPKLEAEFDRTFALFDSLIKT